MAQAPQKNLITHMNKAIQQHTMSTPQITIWEAMEETQRIQLLKQLSVLIRRAKASQRIVEGGQDELC